MHWASGMASGNWQRRVALLLRSFDWAPGPSSSAWLPWDPRTATMPGHAPSPVPDGENDWRPAPSLVQSWHAHQLGEILFFKTKNAGPLTMCRITGPAT